MMDYVQIFAKYLREKIHLKVWHERIFIARTYDDDLFVQIVFKERSNIRNVHTGY